MADNFVGEIRIVGFNFAPTGWATCDGQLLPISQNTALFSLLGTMYGGDGKSNFALPNFQGRAAMGSGQGPGLTARAVGENGGTETVVLAVDQIPAHRHQFRGTTAAATSTDPTGLLMAVPNQTAMYGTVGTPTQLHSLSIVPAGFTYSHPNMQPYLTMNFIIALQGIFPARN